MHCKHHSDGSDGQIHLHKGHNLDLLHPSTMGVSPVYSRNNSSRSCQLKQSPRLLEVDIGLICACAVTLPAFFEKFLFRHTKPLAGKLWSYIVLLRGSSATGYHKSESDSRLANPTQDPASDRNLVATTETTGGRGLLGGGQHARAVCAQGSTARPQDEMDPHQIRLQIDIEQSHETVDVSGR